MASPLVNRVRAAVSSAIHGTAGANIRYLDYVSDAEPIIVGGCGRSGTTLLRVILDSHRDLCCGPESQLFLDLPAAPNQLASAFELDAARVRELFARSRCRPQFIDRFFAEYAAKRGAHRWCEKTPRNIDQLDFILRAFPRGKFVHVIRDGRDVACSLRTHPRHKVVDGEPVPLNTWKPLDECINRWIGALEASRPYWQHPSVIAVKYEDVVNDTEPTLRQLFERLGEEWDPNVLRFHEVGGDSRNVEHFPQNPEALKAVYAQSIGRWRRDLSDDDQTLAERLAGDLLRELGYA